MMTLPQSGQLHLWYVKLDEDLYQASNATLLDAEEMKRAVKFKFEIHRKRYITARAGLRCILSQYLEVSPQNVQILTAPAGKPYVKDSDLQFNASHSHDRALYAVSLGNAVGVDIEKIRSKYNDDVAERFFSAEEYAQFSALEPEQKRVQFFKIWTCKEAVGKALGQGLLFPFSSFSIPSSGQTKKIQIEYQSVSQVWYLENLDLFSGYQAAFATQEPILQLSFFEWAADGKKSWRADESRSLP